MLRIILKDATSSLAAIEAIRKHSQDPGKWEIVIREHKERTPEANAYYWAFILQPLAAELGYTPKEMHRIVCGEYFGWSKKAFNGHVWEAPRRTTTENENGERDVLKGKAFSDFQEFARNLASQNGIHVG